MTRAAVFSGEVRRAPRLRLAAAALAAALPLSLGACGSASPPSPPAGVDGLVVPTPSPDPADFVTGVDNRWLALEIGRTRTYRAAGSEETRVVRVTGTRTVEGLEATVVETTDASGTTTDLYAEDRDGNVWWLGRVGEWQAGDAGAQAGLAMPAVPRVGDGFRTGLAPGVSEQVATVLSVDEPVPGYGEAVVVRLEDRLRPGRTVERAYVAGVGLVRERVVPAAGEPDVPRTFELLG